MQSKNNTLFKKKRRKRGVGEGRESFSPLTIIMFVILIIYVFSMLFLIGWTLLTSVKHDVDFKDNILGFPRPHSPYNPNFTWGWQFENYVKVFDFFFVRKSVEIHGVTQRVTFGMWDMFKFGLFYALGCAFFKALVPMLTAYTCAKFNYFFSKIIHAIVIVTMILPIIGSLPSEIRIARALGLYDKIWGLWLMRANFLGMYFLVFYGMFKSLPAAYTEAAKIDGAGNFSILFLVVLPLVKNTFFTVFLLQFIGFWNDYNTPLIYMPSYPTIAYGLYEVTSTTQNEMTSTPMRMAAAMLMLLPILAIFLTFHKSLLGNLTVGGLKG